MFMHLHNADIIQKSPYARNILVQPGPLTRPPMQRSIHTPSFRLIDFGRAERLGYFTAVEPSLRKAQFNFDMACQEENARVKQALGCSVFD